MTDLREKAIEAMARAICIARGADPDSLDLLCGADNEPWPLWMSWVDEAAAALDALHGMFTVNPTEVTKEMADVGGTTLDNAKDSSWDSGSDGESYNSYEYITPGAPTDVYLAMARVGDITRPKE